jgi:hypothetical protein
VVEHYGINWDALAWFDCAPKMDRKGVFCRMSFWPDRMFFLNHQALFADHVFRPLAQWIETKLMPVHAVGLARTSGGSTWATLPSNGDDRGYSFIVPLRES